MSTIRRNAAFQHLLVLGTFLIVHVFMFRGVLQKIPSLWHKDSIIAQHELIPIFDWNTQYRNQIFKDYTDLTSTDELRLAYTFWVSWIRYYRILPFALILANALSAFMLYGAFCLIGREFVENQGYARFAAFTAALSIHLLMLYFKLVHFYMLGIGFSFFALSLSLTLSYLFFTQEKQYARLILLGLVILFNPSIHYHVLYYFSLAILAIVYLARYLTVRGVGLADSIKRFATLSLAVLCIAFIPYVLYIKYVVSLQSTSVSDTIPISYQILNSNSLDVPRALAVENTSAIDRYLTGNYIAQKASANRLVLIGVTYAVLGLGLIFKRNRFFRTGNHRFVIIFLALFFLLGTWLSLGYTSSGLSFHDILKQAAVGVYDSRSRLLSPILTVFFTLIQILRFSHRFDFIQLYALGIMLTVAVGGSMAVAEQYVKKHPAVRSVQVILLCAVITLTAWDQKAVFLSGDFKGFVAPYTIPPDLKAIKSILDEDPNGKLFILPTMESGRVLYDTQKQDYYIFIDKLFIYYLNHPTYFYGSGSKPENQNTSFLVYRSILFNENWWIDVLRHNIGARYVLYLKSIQPPPSGGVVLPTLMTTLAAQINEAVRSGQLLPRYRGQDFDLYEISTPRGQYENVLVDQRWASLKKALIEHKFDTLGFEKTYVPAQMESFVNSQGDRYVLATEPARAYFDLYAGLHPEDVFRIDYRIAPFDQSLISSLSYSNVVSMFVTLDNTQPYNYFHTIFPDWANIMSAQGVYGTFHTPLRIPFKVNSDGDYRLVVRGYSSAGRVEGTLHNAAVEFERASTVAVPGDYVELEEFTADVHLTAGSHEISLALPTDAQGLLLVDLLLVVPRSQAPDNFEVGQLNTDAFRLDLQWIKITQTERSYFYKVSFNAN